MFCWSEWPGTRRSNTISGGLETWPSHNTNLPPKWGCCLASPLRQFYQLSSWPLVQQPCPPEYWWSKCWEHLPARSLLIPSATNEESVSNCNWCLVSWPSHKHNTPFATTIVDTLARYVAIFSHPATHQQSKPLENSSAIPNSIKTNYCPSTSPSCAVPHHFCKFLLLLLLLLLI